MITVCMMAARALGGLRENPSAGWPYHRETRVGFPGQGVLREAVKIKDTFQQDKLF